MERITEKLDYSTDPMSFFTDRPESGTHDLIGGRTTRGPSYRVVRERGRDDWLLLLTMQGKGCVAGSGREQTATPGSVVLFPPHCPQKYQTDPIIGKWAFLWVHFAPPVHWIPWLPRPGIKDPVKIEHGQPSARQRIEKALADCLRHLRTGLPLEADLAANSFERALILLHQTSSSGYGPAIDERISRAIEWIGQHLGEAFQVATVARAAGLSPSRFGYLFRLHTGLSPQQFTEGQKLDYAAHLLRLNDDQVQEIARTVGYEDPFYFSRCFQARYGKSPTRYRRQA